MNTKRNNAIYISFLAFTLAALVFFISVPVVKAAKYDRHSVDYNKIVSMGSYHLKISNATYLKDTKELCFALSIKEQNYASHESSKPEITTYKLNFYDDNDKYQTEDMLGKFTVSTRNEMTDIITVPNVSEKYDYVYLELTCKTEAYDDPDTKDEFGDIVKGEHHQAKTSVQYFMFDKKDIAVSDSVTEKNRTYDIAIEDENNDSVETTVTKNNNDVKKDAEINSKTEIKSDSTTSEITKDVESKADVADSEVDKKVTTKSGEKVHQNISNEQQYVIDNDNNDYEQQDEQNNEEHNYNVQEPIQTVAPHTTTSRETSAMTTTTTSVVKARSIRLETDYSNNNVVINIGDSTALRVVIEPSNTADKSVTWESNRPDIISVDSNGVVHALGSGKAIITAKLSNNTAMSASCMVTVN